MPTDASRERPPKPGSSRLRGLWPGARVGCIAAALVEPVAGLLSRYHWLADMFTHFQEPAFAITVVALAANARSHRKTSLVLTILAAIQLLPLVRYSVGNPVPPSTDSPERLRVLVSNVLYNNRTCADLARLIRSERPDVIGLVEYGPTCREALADLRSEYPYRGEFASGPSGVALWFRRRPELIDRPEWPVRSGNCLLHATFRFAGKDRQIWVVHPTSPMYRFAHPGNPELTAIATRVRDAGGSRIVMGDMNSTDGSAHFRDFLRVTGLRDSRLGFGRQPSWPTEFLYRIAIDHVLISDDLAVTARRLGPKVGSDHFPILFELAPAATNAVAQSSHASNSTP